MRNVYREVNGEIVIGRSLSALIMDSNGWYVLDDIEIYKDSKIICGCMDSPFDDISFTGEMSLADFARAVERGKIVITVPEGSSLYRAGLAIFRASTVESEWEKKEDYVQAVQDIVHELNGEATTLDYCRIAFLQFLEAPSQRNQEQLRQAYEVIPSPWKMYVLDDLENGYAPITAILVRDVADIDTGWLEEQKQMYSYLRKTL